MKIDTSSFLLIAIDGYTTFLLSLNQGFMNCLWIYPSVTKIPDHVGRQSLSYKVAI